MRDAVVFVAEPLLGAAFTQTRVVVPLAGALSDAFDVTVAAPAIGPEVVRALAERNVHALSGGAWFPTPRHDRDEVASFTLSWIRDAFLGLNGARTERLLHGTGQFRVNFSMTNRVRSDIWYVQSRPLAQSLTSMVPNFSSPLREVGALAIPPVRLLDRHQRALTGRGAGRLLASCEYIADLYRDEGLSVAGVVPMCLFSSDFAPTTASPRRDYIATYLGKETDLAGIEAVASLGFPVKAFGGKSAALVERGLTKDRFPDLEVLGAISHAELLELYTHALFTAFPFTDESFGLVPIESMACGTPVLTYGSQGPAESVVDGATGWFEPDAAALGRRAAVLVRDGVPASWRDRCIARATRYRPDEVAGAWRSILRAGLDARAARA